MTEVPQEWRNDPDFWDVIDVLRELTNHQQLGKTILLHDTIIDRLKWPDERVTVQLERLEKIGVVRDFSVTTNERMH